MKGKGLGSVNTDTINVELLPTSWGV